MPKKIKKVIINFNKEAQVKAVEAKNLEHIIL
jgi:hypothetical protein